MNSVEDNNIQDSQQISEEKGIEQNDTVVPLKKKSKAKIIIIVALIVALVAALAVGGWMLLGNKIKSKKPERHENTIFNEGLVGVRIGDKWGYANEKGNIKIEPQFDTVSFFSEGLAAVEIDDKYGYINKKGEFVIEPQYEYAECFSEGLASVTKGDKEIVIDRKGNVVIDKYDKVFAFSEGLACIEDDGKLGYIDKKGKIVIKPQFDRAWDFTSEGLTTVQKGIEYMCINKQGEVVISGYDNIGLFSHGLVAVLKDGKWGYVNNKGDVVIDFMFDRAYNFSSCGLAVVGAIGAQGVINKKGEYVIEPDYSQINNSFTAQGYTVAYQDGHWKKGGCFIISKNKSFEPENICLVRNKNSAFAKIAIDGFIYIDEESGMYGILDEKGQIKVEAKFDEIDFTMKEYQCLHQTY